MLTGPANRNICNDLHAAEGYGSNQRRNKKKKPFQYICVDFIGGLYSISSVYIIYRTIMAVLYYKMVA